MNEKSSRHLPPWACLLVLAVVLLQGWYACGLNHLYYERYAPFFDSVAYRSQLATVLAISKTEGLSAGLHTALSGSTVSLPWMIAAIIAPLVPYSRLMGIWMQEVWMAALAVSLLIYWRIYRKAALDLALLWSVPPVSIAAIYRANGGVSDFRMDLSLYLLFSLVIVWYLATRETTSRTPWILSALFICLCFLNRATAPVYLGVALGPVLVVRFWAEPSSRWILSKRVFSYWAPAAIVGLLPIIKNWHYIHFYYFVWGADPNANLPLTRSSEHINFAHWNMGYILAKAAAVLLLIHLLNRYRDLAKLDWALVWVACAPVSLLIAKGAGLNPFVAMPTVFGTTMFFLAPCRGPVIESKSIRLASGLVLLACASVAYDGHADHAGRNDGTLPSMSSVRTGIERMRAESARAGWKDAEFLTAHIVDFQVSGVKDVMIYDLGAVPLNGALKLPDGLVLHSFHEDLFGPAVPIAWKQIPGANDDERFHHLVATANRDARFFFFPDEASIDWIEKERPYNFINTKVRRLKKEVLASGTWHMLGEPIRVSNFETVELYVNSIALQ